MLPIRYLSVVRWIAERIAAHKFIPLEQPERIKVWEEIEQ